MEQELQEKKREERERKKREEELLKQAVAVKTLGEYSQNLCKCLQETNLPFQGLRVLYSDYHFVNIFQMLSNIWRDGDFTRLLYFAHTGSFCDMKCLQRLKKRTQLYLIQLIKYFLGDDPEISCVPGVQPRRRSHLIFFLNCFFWTIIIMFAKRFGVGEQI